MYSNKERKQLRGIKEVKTTLMLYVINMSSCLGGRGRALIIRDRSLVDVAAAVPPTYSTVIL